MISTRFVLTILTMNSINIFIGVSADVTCLECPYIPLNLTVDTKVDIRDCKNTAANFCLGNLRLDYTQQNNSFAQFLGAPTEMLILTNGAPMMNSQTSIWLDKFQVQYSANLVCFAGTACGVDDIQKAYAEMRIYDSEPIYKKLVDRLYDSNQTQPRSLKCSHNNDVVDCKDGFCLMVSDGNAVGVVSSCVAKGSVNNPAGVTITRTATNAINTNTQAVVSYACNKDMCNSRQTLYDVLKMLADAKLIDQPQFPKPSSSIKLHQTTTPLFFVYLSLRFTLQF